MKFLPVELMLMALPYALASSGSFNVLQYNVAGLPSLINDNGIVGGKTNAATQIGTKFAQYAFDIIHTQEDFHYHKTLYAADNHPYRTLSSGDIPFGSGLNTLSNFNWLSFRRISWDRCGFNSGDCFTAKGFTYMRMTVAPGVNMDIYNVHADAGDTNGDYSARSDNLHQLADYINDNSADQAVIVFGDLNTLYSRERAAAALQEQTGLVDAWVQIKQGGVIPTDLPECGVPAHALCESLDTVLYKSGAAVRLNATSWDYVTDMFMQDDGNLLSDHNPVLVDFDWSTTSSSSTKEDLRR